MKRTLFLLLLSGCVQPHAHVQPPSTAATQGSINRARQSNQNAQKANAAATTDVSLIDAKANVIKTYWPK